MTKFFATLSLGLFAVSISACSGSGAAVGSPPLRATSSPGAGGASPVASAKPTATASAAPTATATATASAVSGAAGVSKYPAPTSPPQASGYTNVVPSPPPGATCRTGNIYTIGVTTPTGDTEVFTVFEPATLCGNQKYPLVMWGPGWAGSRQTTEASTTSSITGDSLQAMVDANYGVISIDERGFGNDTGTARVMDPNYEGQMDLAAMDWAQANLSWIQYGPTLDGDDYEPVMGTIGGSYGGMYQYMLLGIDKRHRIHAIAPQYSPNDLLYSLFPNGVVKSNWDDLLYGNGEVSGGSTSTGYGHIDPFVTNTILSAIETNTVGQAAKDFFGYHSNSYFCNGTSIATDGDAGSTPLFPATHPPKVNALIWQGMRDTLFTFNNGYNNYKCFQQGGGDVRLLTFQGGHNTLQVVPDPYMYEYYSPTDDLDISCGSLNVDTATVMFFDQYLKGKAGAASAIPTQPCLSFGIPVGGSSSAVLVPSVITGHAGTHFSIPSTAAVAGAGLDTPIAIPLQTYSAPAIIAGLPRLEATIAPIANTGEPILFFGIGQMHASQPGTWDLLDNQLTPIRGAGPFTVDMTGVAAQVAAGDQLALLVFGLEDQYTTSGDANAAKPTVVPVTVSGDVWLPMVTNGQAAP